MSRILCNVVDLVGVKYFMRWCCPRQISSIVIYPDVHTLNPKPSTGLQTENLVIILIEAPPNTIELLRTQFPMQIPAHLLCTPWRSVLFQISSVPMPPVLQSTHDFMFSVYPLSPSQVTEGHG